MESSKKNLRYFEFLATVDAPSLFRIFNGAFDSLIWFSFIPAFVGEHPWPASIHFKLSGESTLVLPSTTEKCLNDKPKLKLIYDDDGT